MSVYDVQGMGGILNSSLSTADYQYFSVRSERLFQTGIVRFVLAIVAIIYRATAAAITAALCVRIPKMATLGRFWPVLYIVFVAVAPVSASRSGAYDDGRVLVREGGRADSNFAQASGMAQTKLQSTSLRQRRTLKERIKTILHPALY